VLTLPPGPLLPELPTLPKRPVDAGARRGSLIRLLPAVPPPPPPILPLPLLLAEVPVLWLDSVRNNGWGRITSDGLPSRLMACWSEGSVGPGPGPDEDDVPANVGGDVLEMSDTGLVMGVNFNPTKPFDLLRLVPPPPPPTPATPPCEPPIAPPAALAAEPRGLAAALLGRDEYAVPGLLSPLCPPLPSGAWIPPPSPRPSGPPLLDPPLRSKPRLTSLLDALLPPLSAPIAPPPLPEPGRAPEPG